MRSMSGAWMRARPRARRRTSRRRCGDRCGGAITVGASEGGDHSPDNLCLLCFAHHQAVHEGRLVIRGRVSTGVVFTHADGRVYGAAPPVIDKRVSDDAVSALRNLDFTAAQARGAIERAASHVGPDASVEVLVAAALRALHRMTSGR
jgi:hypothetical protein